MAAIRGDASDARRPGDSAWARLGAAGGPTLMTRPATGYRVFVGPDGLEPDQGADWTFTLDRPRGRGRSAAGSRGSRDASASWSRGAAPSGSSPLRGRRIAVSVRNRREQLLADAAQTSASASRPGRREGHPAGPGRRGRDFGGERGRGRPTAADHRGHEDAERGPGTSGGPSRPRSPSPPGRRWRPVSCCCGIE